MKVTREKNRIDRLDCLLRKGFIEIGKLFLDFLNKMKNMLEKRDFYNLYITLPPLNTCRRLSSVVACRRE